MHQLSQSAQRQREQDMVKLEHEVDPYQYCRIVLVGLWFLVETMTDKLTPKQRAALAAVTILAGGSLIIFFVQNGMAWMVLVIGIFLGWALSEIAHL